MIYLREIELKNTKELQNNLYPNKTLPEIENMISDWKAKNINGRYFEMLGVFNGEELVGILSIAEQTESSVSFGLEIFEKSRNLGFGTKALERAFEIAKKRGYKLTVNQVRTDNLASIELCKKCGLETNFYEYINKKGNPVYIYVKQL